MNVERWLGWHAAAVAALGTLVLGMGQRIWWLPVLMIFAAITSVIFTDRLRWFVLSRLFGNIAALIALLLCSYQFWLIGAEQQLLSIANLLVYLQVILLYQHKNVQRYWEMAVLSLLQVVVASALNLGFEFGVLLVVYMLLSFSGLVLFFVHRQQLAYCVPETTAPVAAPRKRSLRRQLWGEPVEIGSVLSKPVLAESLLRPTYWKNLSVLTAVTLAFTMALFFSIPRNINATGNSTAGSTSQTGFDPTMSMQQKGQILQSDQVVMRVTFRRPGQDKPLQIIGEPYFYGSVMSEYDIQNNRWSAWRKEPRRQHLALPPDNANLTYQEIVLNTFGKPNLFYCPSAYSAAPIEISSTKSCSFDWSTGQMTLDSEPERPVFSYTLASTGFKGGWQLPVVQHQIQRKLLNEAEYSEERIKKRKAFLTEEKDNLVPFDDDYRKGHPEVSKEFLPLDKNYVEKFPRLKAIAEQVLQQNEPGNKAIPPARAAEILENYFRNNSEYSYTLDFSKVKRDLTLDPIEDFVANHHTGHCEYYASALCLMLQSQKIPARIAVGYKGGEYNSVGGFYVVRQLHAHAWVEVFLEKKQIREGTIPLELVDERGAWLRLDPTPAGDSAGNLQSDVSLLARIDDVMDYMQLVWDDYVLGLDSERQQTNILTPLSEQAESIMAAIMDVPHWAQNLRETAKQIGLTHGTLNWGALVVLVVVIAGLYLLYQLARLLWSIVRWFWARRRSAAATTRPTIEFYERLEKLLQRLDIRREEAQTQQEFAVVASSRLASLAPELAALTRLPLTAAEAFYRQRFGRMPLARDEQMRLDAELDRLAQLVARPSLRPVP